MKQFCEMQKIGQDTFASWVLYHALAHLLIDKHMSEKSDKAGIFPLAAVDEKLLEPGLPLRLG